MLDGSFYSLFRTRFVIKSVLLTSLSIQPLFAISYADGVAGIPKHMEQEWVSRYFNSINEETPVEEVIDFLVSLKGSLTAKGHKVPSLCELCLDVREKMIEKGVEIDDADIEAIYDEIVKREGTLIGSNSFQRVLGNRPIKFQFARHRSRHNRNNDGKVNSKTIFGFVKILTGSLLCFVPFPVVQGAGALLIGNGINDCVDGAREQGDTNEKKGALANPPAQFHKEILDDKNRQRK